LSIRKDFYYKRKARYYLSDEPSSSQQYLCFVLHGYGQLPEYFLKKFAQLDRRDILFVAPEGLHRFYLKGSNGRVGSSWMTKEDRLNDIDDYCALLDQVAEELWEERDYQKVALLGFSQGVATASRWMSRTSQSIDELILWSGAFPPDLSFEDAVKAIGPKPLHLILGDQDEYAKAERLEEQKQHLAENGIIAETQLFKGGHTILKEVLVPLMDKVFPQA
jgi:predicted esterase